MTRNREIDVRFDGGRVRIKCTVGTTERRVAADMRAMLRWLWRQAAYRPLVQEIAAAPRPGQRLRAVYDAYLAGSVADVGPAVADGPLPEIRETWLAGFDCAASHRDRLRHAFARLDALRPRRAVRLTELPALLLEYRGVCVQANTPRAFNYARAGAQALLRDLTGRRHPLYRRVADLQPMREAKQGKKGFALADALAIRDRLPPKAARLWWAMCWTGMGPTEFWGEWTVLEDRLRIRGTKRPGRRWGTEGREVPRVVTPTRPELSLGRFVKHLRAAGAAPRQGRNTFARLLEAAGVPRTRRKLYLGHAAKDVTDLYERHEISAFLAEDAGRLRELLGATGRALEVLSG